MTYKEAGRILREYGEQLEQRDGDVFDLDLKRENRDGIITIKVKPK